MPNLPIEDELRYNISQLLYDATYGEFDATMDKLMQLFESELATRVERTEDVVISKAHSPCECGKGHFGTPVRSVTGSITTYCHFSRVVPSTLTNKSTNKESKL